MGFFEDLGEGARRLTNTVGDSLSGFATGGLGFLPEGTIGGDLGKGIDYMKELYRYPGKQIFGGGKGEEAPDPNIAEKQRLAAIRDFQQRQAKEFRQNLGSNKQAAYQGAENSARQQLAQNIGAVKRDFNRRGLLFSSLRQGGELGEQANTTAQLAQQRARINEAMDTAANEYDKAALDSGLQINEMEMDYQQQLYNRALSNMMQRNQNMSSIGGAVGTGTGGYLANRNKKA